MLHPNTTIIPKELVASLRFPKSPVMLSEEERRDI